MVCAPAVDFHVPVRLTSEGFAYWMESERLPPPKAPEESASSMWQSWGVYRLKSLDVVIPARNEAAGIGQFLVNLQALGCVDRIIVVDNNSTDQTSAIAKALNAECILETTPGYGSALIRGLEESSGDLVVMVEPDGTFAARDILKLLDYAEDFDVVFGSRTNSALVWSGAYMPYWIRIGNWACAKYLELLFNGPSLTDVGCTLKLIRRDALDKVLPKLTVKGSHFSPEFMIRALQSELKVVEIPVNYRPRLGPSNITGGNPGKAFRLGLVMIAFMTGQALQGLRRARPR